MSQELTMSEPILLCRFMPIDAGRLRSLRNHRGWTQGDLARAAGYSERVIRKAEAGGTLSIRTIRDLAQALSSCGRTITVSDLTLDLIAVAQQFVQSYDSAGKFMLYQCEQMLAEDFVFCTSARDSDLLFSGNWFSRHGLQHFLELFFAKFSRTSSSLKPTFESRKNQVLAQYIDILTYRGKELPMAVKLRFQFEKGLICRLDQEYTEYGSM